MASDLTTIDKPTGPPSATAVRVPDKEGAKGVKEVRGKLKRALDLMVYGDEDGNRYDFITASRKVDFTPHAMRKALERPHVQRYLREQKQVFRASASSSNIRRAIELRDQDENRTAAIQAIRYLDGIEESPGSAAAARGITPGVTVVIVNDRPAPQIDNLGLIEVNPLSDKPDVGNER